MNSRIKKLKTQDRRHKCGDLFAKYLSKHNRNDYDDDDDDAEILLLMLDDENDHYHLMIFNTFRYRHTNIRKKKDER